MVVSMKGTPTAVYAVSADDGSMVHVWCSSPTGGISDSLLFAIPCVNKAQAKEVVQAWHAAWDFFPLTQEAKDQREVALFFDDVTGAS